MRRELPTFYYLDHFDQFVGHCLGTFGDILSGEHREVLETVKRLPKHTRAMLVRAVNRKPDFIKVEDLEYQEIPRTNFHLKKLLDGNFISAVADRHLAELLLCLNKSELLIVAEHFEVKLKSSTPKPLLHKKVAGIVQSASAEARQSLLEHKRVACYIFINAKSWMSYLLFLYFGDTERTLSQFSLRDLGLARSRKEVKLAKRFSSQHNAEYAYQYLQHYRYIKLEDNVEQLLEFVIRHYAEHTEQASISERDEAFAQQGAVNGAGLEVLENSRGLENLKEFRFPETSEPLADSLREKFVFKLARKIAHECKATAIAIAGHGKSDKCQEFYIRNRYHFYKEEGARARIREELEQHMQDPQSDTFFVFCRDFYERKFHKKNRSFYTDLLDRAEKTLFLDEAFKHQVERKVCEHYLQEGGQAWRTENRLWKTLFGLVFWEILYNEEVEYASEFDRTPLSIKTGEFGALHKQAIKDRLDSIQSAEKLVNQLLVIAALYYGEENGIFQWSRKMLDTAVELIPHLPLSAIKSVLRKMADNYHQLKDGFPDIAVLENDQLLFEEVKAPGDKIRRNQLRAMRVLEDAGLATRICKVEWRRDFNQRYAVVDLETTGGRKEGNRITEIGLVILENQEVVETWSTLVNPERRIPYNITQLTGISNDMVATAPRFSEVADTLMEKLEGAIFVAHNVNFDYGFIQMELHRMERHISMPKICTVRESRENFKKLQSYSLKNLSQHFGIALENHHRALDDAKACAEILLRNFDRQLQSFTHSSDLKSDKEEGCKAQVLDCDYPEVDLVKEDSNARIA